MEDQQNREGMNLENDSRHHSDAMREYRNHLAGDRGIPAGTGSTAEADPARAQPEPGLDEAFLDRQDEDDELFSGDPDGIDHETSRDAVDPISSNADVLNLSSEYLLNDEQSGYNLGFGDPDEDLGTTDAIAAIEDGLTYFAPVDPVISSRTSDRQGAVVAGGFASGSRDELTAPTDLLAAPLEPDRVLSDDDLAEAVVEALRTASYTTDIPVEVSARNGVVYLRGQVGSMDDAEQVMAVAGDVQGVVDVNDDELDYEGM